MNDQERAVMQQALDFIRAMNSHGWLLADYESDMERTVADLEAVLAQEQAEPVSTAAAMRDARLNAGWGSSQEQAEQDPALSAALGWPGGISDPVLDRKTLLQQVAIRARSRA